MKSKLSTKVLVEGGLMVALAFVLGEIKLFQMPQGGSVTLGIMIPIFLFSLRHGAGAGIFCGVVLGLIEAAIGGYIISIPQFFLDYPIALGLLGLAGIFSNGFRKSKSITPVLLGTVVGTLGRYIAAVLSGVIFFAEYAGEMNPWLYSLSYNGTYLAVEFAVACVVIFLLRTFVTTSLSGDNIGR